MKHESLRASDLRPSRPRTAIPAGRHHSPPRTPWAARVLGSPSPAACAAPPTPRALRAARRAQTRATAPYHVPSPRSPTRGNTPHRCSLSLGARTCTPPPDAARLARTTPSAEPSGSPAESPMRCQRPESCVPLMGGAGWADPLPAMRAALCTCGLRLTHRRLTHRREVALPLARRSTGRTTWRQNSRKVKAAPGQFRTTVERRSRRRPTPLR